MNIISSFFLSLETCLSGIGFQSNKQQVLFSLEERLHRNAS